MTSEALILGADPEAAYEAHRAETVDHMIKLRLIDAEYARYALSEYVSRPGCPFPRIGDDVRAKWSEHRSRNSAGADSEPAASR